MTIEKHNGEYLDLLLQDVFKCVRCGFCNSVCPTSNISISYMGSRTSRGRIVILQAYFSNILNKPIESDEIQEAFDYCFGCRRCLDICPAGVKIPQIVWRVKSLKARKRLLHRFLFSNYGLLEKICSKMPKLSNTFLSSSLGKTVLERLYGIDRRVSFPKFYEVSLESWFRRRRFQNSGGRKLSYFVDVFTNYHEVDLGIEIVTTLEKLGYSISIPPQKEAGTILFEEGLIEEALKIARYNIENLYKSIVNGSVILTGSPAAYLALKKDYPEFLGDEKSRIVADNTFDVLELLLRDVEEGRVKLDSREGFKITYHHSCFTKASGLTKTIKRLLSYAEYDLKEVDQCCGIAGLWGMKKKHFDQAIEVGSGLFSELKNLAIPVTSQSETCRLQIRHNTGIDVKHPFQYISEIIEPRP
ncbi:MAG: 4Fe-4S dicluster domain-containing protein [Nitrososphaerota archaeon]